MPAAPESTCREFAGIVDDMVCASMPTPFLAVGESFWDFRQVTDAEVRELLSAPTGVPTEAERPADLIAAAAIDAPAGVPPADVLDDLIGDARVVLIGESSHGTHEFYEARAEITKWLIEHKGFNAVAAEADWPDAYRVNRYVRGLGEDLDRRGGAARLRAVPGLDVAQQRGGRFRGVAALAQRPVRGAFRRTKERDHRRTAARPASTAWISTACTAPCRR